jgi:site-specific recombinase XerD
MLPSLQLLEKVKERIKTIPNRKKESKRGIRCGLFLLGYQAGLRVNEAISFDLGNKTQKGLYSVQSKGKRERFVFIPKQTIKELKSNN